ncbi:unnamed protein product, partial [Chrysoparadoxa australica]
TPTYIIAEAGVHHNGDINIALDLVAKAKEIGADCIKFQTFKANEVVTEKAPKANYQLKVTDKDETQFEMLKKLELDFQSYQLIVNKCNELGIDFLSTPYNKKDVDFLMDLDVAGFKIASGQLIELEFIEYVAKKGLPIILSTGMGTLSEVANAVECIRNAGNDEIVVLQCVTNYPAEISDVNLHAMVSMGHALDVVIGYSDHVPKNYASYASVALGAKIIEKHFTLDTSMDGPDHSSSLNVEEFAELIKGVRAVESALGKPFKKPSRVELENSEGMRRSIVFNKDIKEGEILRSEHFTFKRPATGLNPKMIDYFLGKKMKVNASKDTFLEFKHVIW